MANDLLDTTNRSRYNASEYAATYSGVGAWTDDGERAAVASAASDVRGRPILDVGAGAGRMASLLRLLSDDYVAIDYADEMVRRFRDHHPDLTVEQADARNLARWANGRFGLVVFSHNGIDSVNHEDRRVVLSEFRRVLQPNGILILSMLNKDGPAFGEAPWQMGRYGQPQRSLPERAARFAVNLLRRSRSYIDVYKYWWRLRGRTEDHGDWGIAPLLGPGAGLLVHYASLPYAVREVRAAGFDVLNAFLDNGERVEDLTQPTKVTYFHLVARRSPDFAAGE